MRKRICRVNRSTHELHAKAFAGDRGDSAEIGYCCDREDRSIVGGGKGSRGPSIFPDNKDAVFILSVGGGNVEKNISPNLVAAANHAKAIGAKIIGILGRDGGHTARVADASVIVPTVNPETVTPHAEAFQAVIWHLLVSHPLLKASETKWESLDK